mgnify:CR=1 FL=1
MPDEEREARRALACVVEAGEPRLASALGKAEPQVIWERVAAMAGRRLEDGSHDPWVRRASAIDLDAVRAGEVAHGLRFIIPGDDEWPAGLSALEGCPAVQGIAGAPIGLWVRGPRPLAALSEVSVSIVGSRAATSYGERVASSLAGGLAEAGVCVISGGAYGIDAAAHRGALGEKGTTVAMLACGLDDPYPKLNVGLLESVARAGALVSEYPPGAHPTRPRFLARNRLIAALSQGTVLVEAAARSGARNTVSWATGCGRPVMAVPGPIGNATSYTPHRLIREGEAVLVSSVDEVRELIAPLGTVALGRPRAGRLLDTLTDDQRSVYEALPARGGRTVDDLAMRAGLWMPLCLAALSILGGAGLATCRSDGRWRLGSVSDQPVLIPDVATPPALQPGSRPTEPTMARSVAQKEPQR